MRILFAGPSLVGKLDDIQEDDPELVIAGPVVWGDVAKAVLNGATTIGIVDGCFEQTRSVWHKEILYALSEGVSVAGAASMGALRAAECAQFGMVGIGEVFQMYLSGELIDDSDVALVHATREFGYQPLSEPRVNVFATLNALRTARLISTLELQSAMAAARKTHYAELNCSSVLGNLPNVDLRRVQRLIAWANQHRVNVKQKDALQLVEWIKSPETEFVPSGDWRFSQSSQWRAMMSDIDTVAVS